jgi:L-ascorbate metabolism protein UlaG (beta-lactamase superfamily)
MSKVHFHYLGHASFEIITETDTVIYLDPFIEGNPDCPITFNDIERADIVLVTHGAFDHMGQAIELVKKTGAILIGGPDIRVHAFSEGISEDQFRVLGWGGEIEISDIKVRSLKADHISFFKSKNQYLSSIAMSFLITTPENLRIYAAGDTSIFYDLQLFGQLYRPHIGLIGVGGFPGYFAELSASEAALVAKWLCLNVAIPIHYPSKQKEGKTFLKICKETAPHVKVHILKPGEHAAYSAKEMNLEAIQSNY